MILKQWVRNGYNAVCLRNNNKKFLSIHRLIAMAFIHNPNNLPCINHINGVRNDNRIENLEWCTHKQNSQHSWDIGLQKKSENQRRAVIATNKKNSGINNYASRPILDTQNGIFYENVLEASTLTGIPRTTLYRFLNNERPNKTNLIFA